MSDLARSSQLFTLGFLILLLTALLGPLNAAETPNIIWILMEKM